MTGSATAIWLSAVVAVVGILILIVMVRWAARHPGHNRRKLERMRGVVQGGQHVGGGRSVAPRRDAPVPEDGGTPPEPEEQVESHESRSIRQSPMDL